MSLARKILCSGIALLCLSVTGYSAFAAELSDEVAARDVRAVVDGAWRVSLDAEALADAGVVIVDRKVGEDFDAYESGFRDGGGVEIETSAGGLHLVDAWFVADTAWVVSDGDVTTTFSPLQLRIDADGQALLLARGDAKHLLNVTDLLIEATSDAVYLSGSLTVTAGDGAESVVGMWNIDAATSSVAANSVEAWRDEIVGGAAGGIAGEVPEIGVDLIVQQIGDIRRFGKVGTKTGYSIATKACNIGDVAADWFAGQPNKPVISQNMFRLKDGRLTQIGMSWVKHAFEADDEDCGVGTCNGDPLGQTLQPNCGDTYLTGVNGSQINLGPRFEVNPTTGVHIYPFTTIGFTGDAIYKRIQVEDADIDPDLNPDALYFVEAQYVAEDEASWGTHDNNASYATVLDVVETEEGVFDLLGPAGDATVPLSPGIMAWEDHDADVSTVIVDVPGDRRLLVAHKAVELPGGGMWRYEYAVQNLNSDRAVGSFSVPVAEGIAVSNIGFHDVDSHSGDGSSPVGSYYSTADWPGAHTAGAVTWMTDDYATDDRANAIRWGTMYNFWFDAPAPPVEGNAVLGMFKPGVPESVTAGVLVPSSALLVVGSAPPSGAIDARQPSAPDGSSPAGWSFFDIAFSGDATELTAGDFDVTQDGGVMAAPGILSVSTLDPEILRITLDRPIEPGAWTNIVHAASDTTLSFGYLPADANNDGTSTPSDILRVIDNLNGIGTPLNIWQSDVDRSGEAGPADILRVIDLLNGAGAYDAWLDVSLP